MAFNSAKHHRKSIRLKDHNYSEKGYYYITLCTQNRENLFGIIVHHQMILNDCGTMLQDTWNEIPKYYTGIEIDAFQIMPNHIHGIIVIVGAGPRACPIQPQRPKQTGQPRGVAPTEIEMITEMDTHTVSIMDKTLSLPDVVHRFKTMTTKRYIDGVKNNGWKSFDKRLWQRNYYEHIIRNEEDLLKIREYIANNPLNWLRDKNYHEVT